MTINHPISTNHYLQSEAWAKARENSPWKLTKMTIGKEYVKAYARRTPLGQTVHIPGYVPDLNQVLLLSETIKKYFPKAVVCKVETCAPYDENLSFALESNGWLKARTTQYAFTVELDLTKSTDSLRTDLKKRARNEINRARNNKVEVFEQPTDKAHFEQMYQLLQVTATRKRFNVHNEQFTLTLWENMSEINRLRLFFALHEGEILAAATIIISDDGRQAWYKEGASTQLRPGLNAPRYLLWEIALKLKISGVEKFDLGGIPDPATYQQSSMKGIYIFKTAYSATVTKMMPAYEFPLGQRYRLWPKLELGLRKLANNRGANWY